MIPTLKQLGVLAALLLAVPFLMSPVPMILTLGAVLFIRVKMLRRLRPWMKTAVVFVLSLLLLLLFGCYDYIFTMWFWVLNTAIMLAIVMHAFGSLIDLARERRSIRDREQQEQEQTYAEWYNPDTGRWER